MAAQGPRDELLPDDPFSVIVDHLGPKDQSNVAAVNRQSRRVVASGRLAAFKKHCKLLDDFKAALHAKEEGKAATLMLALLREPKERHFLKKGAIWQKYGLRDVLEDVTAIESKYHDTIGDLVQTIIDSGQVHQLAEAICTNLTDDITANYDAHSKMLLPAGTKQVFQSALLPALPDSHCQPPLSFNLKGAPKNYPWHLAGWPMLLTFDNGKRELYFREWRNIALIGDAVFRQDNADAQWESGKLHSLINVSLPKKMVWALLLIWDDRNVEWNAERVNVDRSVHLRAPFTDVCLE